MKILHTSDWHLGKRLESFSRLEEQEAVLKEIYDIADQEEVQAVIIAGDLYDTFNPSAEVVELFYRYMKKLANNGKRVVIAIAGNHDSPDRIEAPDALARECGILFAGFPNTHVFPFELESGLKIHQSAPGFIELQIPGTAHPLRLLLTPYANELRLKSYLGNENSEVELRSVLRDHWSTLSDNYCDTKGVNILISHLLFFNVGDELPEEPEDERPILHIGGAQAIYTESIPEQVQYVALGHLHREQIVSNNPCPVAYCGSPLGYSFGEADQDKYVMIIDVEPGQPAIVKKVKLHSGKKLIRKRFESIDEAVEWLTQNQDVYIELTIVSDTYLTVTDRKRLIEAHNNIVVIIPEMKHIVDDADPLRSAIDLSKNMEELFIDFFKFRKGQEPNDRILGLFKEVLSEEDGL